MACVSMKNGKMIYKEQFILSARATLGDGFRRDVYLSREEAKEWKIFVQGVGTFTLETFLLDCMTEVKHGHKYSKGITNIEEILNEVKRRI